MAGAVDWAFAESVAVRVCGKDPFAASYHYDSLAPDFAECTSRAEELVAVETGLRSLAGPARSRVTDREGWIRANMASFQRLLRPLLDRFGERVQSSPLLPVTSRLAGAELGLMLGWMSTRVLGQYDLLVIEDENPDDQDIVYYVGPNVLALEKQYGFPPAEFRLWLALHEVTHRAQFTGVPWIREHFLGLVHQTLDAVEPDPDRLFGALDQVVAALREGRNPLDDGGMMTLLAGPEQRAVLDQVGGLMSLLEGHGDVTMDRAGAELVPSAERFGRVLRQRREAAVGLDQAPPAADRPRSQARAVRAGRGVHRGGRGRRGPVAAQPGVGGAGAPPESAEIREPRLWIERIDALLPAAG